MARVLSFLIRYFSNYYTLHRSDLAARAAPLDPRLHQMDFAVVIMTLFIINFKNVKQFMNAFVGNLNLATHVAAIINTYNHQFNWLD